MYPAKVLQVLHALPAYKNDILRTNLLNESAMPIMCHVHDCLLLLARQMQGRIVQLTCISFCSHFPLLLHSRASASSQVFSRRHSANKQTNPEIRHSNRQSGSRMVSYAAAASEQAESKDLLIIGETCSSLSRSIEGGFQYVIRAQTGLPRLVLTSIRLATFQPLQGNSMQEVGVLYRAGGAGQPSGQHLA